MSFAYPLVLLLLCVPVAALVLQWKWHGFPVALPFDGGDGPSGRWKRLMLHAFHSLPWLLVAVVIVILAGPQRFGSPGTRRKLTNIQFCVDVSGSMTSDFGDGNRYDAAMESIAEFVDYREGDAFGLTVFGTHFVHWVPLTTDPSAFACAAPFLQPMRLPRWFGGGTRIGQALKECRKVLANRESGDKMIILLSDGYSSDLSGGADEEIARGLRSDGIVVYAVHIGSGAAPDQLVNVASRTGGETFAAGDPKALEFIFKRIDAMEKAELERTSAEVMDDFRPWTVAGFSVLGLVLIHLSGLRYNPW